MDEYGAHVVQCDIMSGRRSSPICSDTNAMFLTNMPTVATSSQNRVHIACSRNVTKLPMSTCSRTLPYLFMWRHPQIPLSAANALFLRCHGLKIALIMPPVHRCPVPVLCHLCSLSGHCFVQLSKFSTHVFWLKQVRLSKKMWLISSNIFLSLMCCLKLLYPSGSCPPFLRWCLHSNHREHVSIGSSVVLWLRWSDPEWFHKF